MIPRSLKSILSTTLRPGRVWMLFGARRVGKTQLIESYLKTVPEQKWYKGHGEDRDLADILEARSATRLRQLFDNYDGFFLDEAQSVPDVGQGNFIYILKVLYHKR